MGTISRTSIATWVLAVAASIVIALSAAALYASEADAAVTPYCGVLVAPMDQCSQTVVFQNAQQNVAQYSGSGTVSVCQKLTIGGSNRSRTCGNNWADSGINSWGESRCWVGNNSANNHTIHGVCTGTN